MTAQGLDWTPSGYAIGNMRRQVATMARRLGHRLKWVDYFTAERERHTELKAHCKHCGRSLVISTRARSVDGAAVEEGCTGTITR